jgi:hypothetical protein
MSGVVRLVRLIVLAWLAAGLAACNKAQARVEPFMALNVPSPPARVAVPVQLPEPEEPEPPEPPPPIAPAAAPSRPRTDTAPGRSDRPAAAAPAPQTPVETAPVLQTTANIGALEQKATGLLEEAQQNLKRVNYRDLGAQAREQYDRALGFIRNARSALQIRNFMFAEQLATKAAAVARELVKG